MRRIQLAIGVAIVAIALVWPFLTKELDAKPPHLPDYFLEPVDHAPDSDAIHKTTTSQHALTITSLDYGYAW